jgi:hypothetical protein
MSRPYTPPNVTHAEALFTDTARVARLIAAQRVDDARTNDALAAAINLGKGNVISMLRGIGDGAPGKPLSPDNLLRLAKEVGLEAILPEIALLLLAVPNRTTLVREVLFRQMTDADPHIASRLGAVRAMADQIVEVPSGTAPEIAKEIESARQVAKDYFEEWTMVEDTLKGIWEAREERGEVVDPFGKEGHAARAMAEGYVNSLAP